MTIHPQIITMDPKVKAIEKGADSLEGPNHLGGGAREIMELLTWANLSSTPRVLLSIQP